MFWYSIVSDFTCKYYEYIDTGVSMWFRDMLMTIRKFRIDSRALRIINTKRAEFSYCSLKRPPTCPSMVLLSTGRNIGIRRLWCEGVQRIEHSSTEKDSWQSCHVSPICLLIASFRSVSPDACLLEFWGWNYLSRTRIWRATLSRWLYQISKIKSTNSCTSRLQRKLIFGQGFACIFHQQVV